MNKEQKQFIKELNGQEIFFKDFGVVAIIEDSLVHCGKKILKITNNNFKEIQKAYFYTEYGTWDINNILKIEGY